MNASVLQNHEWKAMWGASCIIHYTSYQKFAKKQKSPAPQSKAVHTDR
jgi:hypothetical protein